MIVGLVQKWTVSGEDPHVPKVERIDLEENSMYRISLDRVWK